MEAWLDITTPRPACDRADDAAKLANAEGHKASREGKQMWTGAPGRVALKQQFTRSSPRFLLSRG